MFSLKIIQRSKPLSDGTYPIVLRIIKNRKRKLISLDMSCKQSDFINQEFKRSATNYRIRNQILSKVKIKAYEIFDEFQLKGNDFTLEDFERKFRGIDTHTEISVFNFFDTIIDELTRSGKIGNAAVYFETKRSLFKFAPKEVQFKVLTSTFLDQYEVFMRERKNEDGGISVKMRTLRALFKKAIEREVISRSYYPFDKYKISKLKKKSIKRALSIDEFRLFRDVNLTNHPHLQDSHNFFMFSFYTRGMNFVDMMKLKESNIRNKRIFYVRSKTKKSFNIEILPIVQEIIDYYLSQNRITSFIFPILLKEGLSQVQIENRKKKTRKKYNSDLKKIAAVIGIQDNITSYVARHTYATLMKQQGVSMDKISESMGHGDLQVTKTYLKEFDNDTLDDANSKLLDI